VIAADTSTWVAFLEGDAGRDTNRLDEALREEQVLMVPAVLTELLSDPSVPPKIAATLRDVPVMEIEPGYWQRAGELRAGVLSKGRRARLGDALIAQACLDNGIALITRDRDFRFFAESAGLVLAV
jgi:predicted nucleic acid-binding protein